MSHTKIKTRTNHTIRKKTYTGKCNSVNKDTSGNIPYLFYYEGYVKLNCKLLSKYIFDLYAVHICQFSDKINSGNVLLIAMPVDESVWAL